MKYRMAIVASLLLVQASFGAEPQQAGLHYRPPGAIFGDPIPFYHDGVHHLFYLCPDLIVGQEKKKSLAWRHLASRDLVHWEVMPPAILPDSDDRMIATGSIVEQDGLFHAFYTTAQRDAEGLGLPSVRVARSRDLITWTKEPGEPLLLLKRDVPSAMYDTLRHWRDPHVFWNPDAKQWWLAIAAQEKTSLGYPYAGAVALATSTDLRTWTVQRQPLLTTREGPASECPDIFPLGDEWGMIYYADTSRIRLAPTPAGPWRRATGDPPWGLHFLASKTEFDGERRIAHAYIQQSIEDFTRHKYGGSMALPRELYMDERGRVATRLVAEIIAACKDDATSGKGAAVFTPSQGDPVTVRRKAITLAPDTGAAAMAVWKDAPDDLFLTADVAIAPGATLNLLLRGNPLEAKPGPGRPEPTALDDNYILSLDAHRNVVTLKHGDVWNRMPAMRSQPIDLPTDRPFKLHLMLHGDILEVFVDDRISVTARVQLTGGALALLARDGKASLTNLRLTRIPTP